MTSLKKAGTFAAALLLAATAAFAVEGDMLSQHTFGSSDSDFGYDLQTTADGGFILAGRTYGFGASGSDAYLVRLDADANEIWSTNVGTIADDGCNAVTETADGGFVMVGWVDINSFTRKAQAMKVDADGNLLWQKFYLADPESEVTFIEDELEAVLETANGDLVMAGTANSIPYRQPWLLRTDAEGNMVWQAHHELQGNGKDYLTDIVETPAGDIACSGYSGDSNTFTDFDPNAFAFSSTGAFLWQRTLEGFSPADYAYGIGLGPDGNLAVVGKSSISTLWRLTPGGEAMSTTHFSTGGAPFDVTATSDGGLLLVGTVQEPDLSSQAWIIKTDADGAFQWDNRFGGAGNEIFYKGHERANGEYVLFGQTNSYGAGGSDYYLLLAEGPADLTAVPEAADRLVATLSAYPNPFNPKTTISFALPAAASTTVQVLDATGRRVRTLLDGAALEAGRQQLAWDGRDDAGHASSTGVYFVQVRAGAARAHEKLVLVK